MYQEKMDEFFIEPKYEDFYNSLAKHKWWNKMQKKFIEIKEYFDSTWIDKDFIEFLTQLYENDYMLKNFAKSSRIWWIKQFLLHCNKKWLLLNNVDNPESCRFNDRIKKIL